MRTTQNAVLIEKNGSPVMNFTNLWGYENAKHRFSDIKISCPHISILSTRKTSFNVRVDERDLLP